MYFGVRGILNGLRLKCNINHRVGHDLLFRLTKTSFSLTSRGGRDQRPNTQIPEFNRGSQSSRTRHGNRGRGKG